jgi:hypothetical protein
MGLFYQLPARLMPPFQNKDVCARFPGFYRRAQSGGTRAYN